MRIRPLKVWLALALVTACQTSEVVNLAPSGTVTASNGSATVGSGGSTSAGGAAPVKRTVIQRNPYGNVDRPNNLLWDGDFEWMGPFVDQYGWLSGSNFGISYALPKLVVGARCQSGVRCAELAPERIAIATGVASKGNALAASVWVKPEGGACSDVQVVVLPAASPMDAVALSFQNEDGWCHFEGLVPALDSQVYLYIANESDGAVVVDNAVVEAETGGQGVRRGRALPLARRADRKYQWVAEAVRRARKPTTPPPNKAKEAFKKRWRVTGR